MSCLDATSGDRRLEGAVGTLITLLRQGQSGELHSVEILEQCACVTESLGGTMLQMPLPMRKARRGMAAELWNVLIGPKGVHPQQTFCFAPLTSEERARLELLSVCKKAATTLFLSTVDSAANPRLVLDASHMCSNTAYDFCCCDVFSDSQKFFQLALQQLENRGLLLSLDSDPLSRERYEAILAETRLSWAVCAVRMGDFASLVVRIQEWASFFTTSACRCRQLVSFIYECANQSSGDLFNESVLQLLEMSTNAVHNSPLGSELAPHTLRSIECVTLQQKAVRFFNIGRRNEACEAASKAVDVLPTPDALLLDLKCSCGVSDPTKAASRLSQMVRHQETTPQQAVEAALTLCAEGHFDAASQALVALMHRFKSNFNSYVEIAKCFLGIVLKAWRPSLPPTERTTQAKQTLEDLAAASEQTQPSEWQRSCFVWCWDFGCFLLNSWCAAQENNHGTEQITAPSQLDDAIAFLRFSSSRFGVAGDNLERAKVLRTLARAQCEANLVDDALRSAYAAQNEDSRSVHTAVLLFDLHVRLGNLDVAVEDLHSVSACDPPTMRVDACRMAVGIAYRRGHIALCEAALEKYVGGLLGQLQAAENLVAATDPLAAALRSCLECARKSPDSMRTHQRVLWAARIVADTRSLHSDENLRFWHVETYNSGRELCEGKNVQEALAHFELCEFLARKLSYSQERMESSTRAVMAIVMCTLQAATWECQAAEYPCSSQMSKEHLEKVLALASQSFAEMPDETDANARIRALFYVVMVYANVQLKQLGEEKFSSMLDRCCALKGISADDLELLCVTGQHASRSFGFSAARSALTCLLRDGESQGKDHWGKVQRFVRRCIDASSSRDEQLQTIGAFFAAHDAATQEADHSSLELCEARWLATACWNNVVYYTNIGQPSESWIRMLHKATLLLPEGDELRDQLGSQLAAVEAALSRI